MTWLELYQFLSDKANKDISDPILWGQKVMIHNIETGDEYLCDLLELDHNDNKRIVLSIIYED